MYKMKNLISMLLVLAICFSFAMPIGAAELTDANGTAQTPVVLNVEAATFSVTVPTGLPVDVAADGMVSVATDAKIINNSAGPVKVVNMAIESVTGWTIANYNTDLRNELVDSNQIGMVVNDCQTTGANAIVFDAANFTVMMAKNDSTDDECHITYNAKVTPLSDAFSTNTVANIVLTVDWDIDKSVFANNTWAEIAEACQNDEVPSTWVVGDTKEMLIDGESYTVAIIGKDHDSYADGSGTAPLTFQVIDIVSTHNINDINTTSGGWDGSDMYTYLNDESTGLINSFGDDIKNNIKAINKYTNVGSVDAGGIATTVVASADKLFLLAEVEVIGDRYFDWLSEELGDAELRNVYKLEGNQYAYYAPNGTITTEPTYAEFDWNDDYNCWYNKDAATLNLNLAASWWLRTPANGNSAGWYYIEYNGKPMYWEPSKELGVSFGFCF